jgi:hypothetical protein
MAWFRQLITSVDVMCRPGRFRDFPSCADVGRKLECCWNFQKISRFGEFGVPLCNVRARVDPAGTKYYKDDDFNKP